MPSPDPTLLTAIVSFGSILGGWTGERALRALPTFPYRGEKLSAFVAVVGALSLFFAALGNWATGTLTAEQLTGLFWATGQALVSILVLLGVYQGKSPQALQREQEAELEVYRAAWHNQKPPQ